MTPRILIIGEYGSRNGGENSFLAFLPRLIDRGFDFHGLVPPDSEFSESLASAGCSLTPLSLHVSDGQRKTQSVIRSELEQHINRIRPDLVHCNSLSTSRLTGPVTESLQRPSLGYLRDILKLSRTAVADINQLDRIIAVSNATKEWHCGQGIDREKTEVIYNGVDGDIFFPATLSPDRTAQNADCLIRAELGIPSGSPILLFVGQIGIRKGVDALVTVFLNVVKQLPDTRLLIVGKRHSQKQESIEYERRILSQGDSSAAHRNIHWLGNRPDVPALMRAATLLIHPARQEPLGRVLLEAAASGLPIITTNVGGTPEIVTIPKTQPNLLLEPSDTEGMTQSAIDLLNDPIQRRTIGEQLRAIALDRFSILNGSDQLIRCYRNTLNL